MCDRIVDEAYTKITMTYYLVYGREIPFYVDFCLSLHAHGEKFIFASNISHADKCGRIFTLPHSLVKDVWCADYIPVRDTLSSLQESLCAEHGCRRCDNLTHMLRCFCEECLWRSFIPGA